MERKGESMQKTTKQLLAGFLSATLAVTALPVTSLAMPQKEAKAASVTLQNPRIVKDYSMEAGQKVTWDCIWFGSYPQREVVADAAGYDAIYEDYYNPQTDIIEDAALFQKLETASGWSDNEITLDGNKYRRMKKEDATYSSSDSASRRYYRWKDNTSWHYFRYEPIKWRVLSTAGGQAFLQADLALDDQSYNNNDTNVTWESSSMRSWLNGYGPETNEPKEDYRSDSFLQDAFSSAQQQAIRTTEVENADNLEYGTEGGNHTTDKIFLLSEQEVYGTKAGPYGFAESSNTHDEARRRKSSTYAKAKGVWSNYGDGAGYDGNCGWWLRTPGDDAKYTLWVNNNGYVVRDGNNVYSDDYGMCPALNLDLSSSDLWSYAGTVCSDGSSGGVMENGICYSIYADDESRYAVITGYNGTEKEVIIPQSVEGIMVKSIGSYAFANKEIENVILPEGLENIDSCAFYTCENLVNLRLPESVTEIGSAAFFSCESLQNINWPENLQKIHENAFRGCMSLSSVHIPASVTLIGMGAFTYCGGLKSVTVAKENPKYDSRNNCDAIIDTENNQIIGGCGVNKIPSDITSIASEAYSGYEGFEKIEIPANVTEIDTGAFIGCNNVREITVDAGNTVYDSRENCNAIIQKDNNVLITACKTTQIPKSVTSIGNMAFAYLTLESIDIPDNVTSIGNQVFINSTIERINISDSVTQIGFSPFSGCNLLKQIKLSKNMKRMNSYGFAECNGFESIVIPEGFTDLDYGLFMRCTGLNSIYLPSTLTSIETLAFYGCDNLKEIYYAGTKEQWDEIKIDGGNDILKTATIYYESTPPVDPEPEKPEQVKPGISNPSETITPSQNSPSMDIKQGDIVKVKNAKYSVTETGAVKTVEYCGTISKTQKNIKIPATVVINQQVYKVTSISRNAFKGNKKLKAVTIGKNIKKIGAGAFSGCKKLKNIKITSTQLTKKSVGKNAFKGIDKKAVIKVPKKKLKAYKSILKGKGQAKSVKIKK